jgi:hypothetical protein
MVVVIEPDGMVGVSRHTDHTNSDLRAPAQAWKPDAVEIGLGGLTTTYRVDEAPYEKDGAWRMVIEGVPLVRVSTDVGGGAAPVDSDEPRGAAAPSP